MKALLAILLTLLVATLSAQDKYTETMLKNIQLAYDAKTVAEYQDVANAFARIAAAEKTKWEPHYYEAYSYIMMTNVEKDNAKKDGYLDLATIANNKAKAILKNDSEITTLEGFIFMMRVTIDPAERGQSFSGMAFQSLSKATAQNPENPRALTMLAQMQYGTAQFFGSSTDEACASVIKALQKYETAKTENVLAPQWGKPLAERLKGNCKY